MKIASFGLGFLVGFGAGLVAREGVPILKELASPIARTSMKLSIRMVEKSKESVMRLGEIIEDLIAEVQADLRSEKPQASKAAPKVKRPPKTTTHVEVSPAFSEVA